MSSTPAAIADAYDAERFRADGKRLVDALADQLAAWHRGEGAVLPWHPPAEARATWALGDAALTGGGDLVADLTRFVAASTGLASPRCLGHQVPPPLPGAVLAEMASALVNNGMAVYEMGPASVPIELAVVDWMCARLGLPAGATGVLTSGGSLGNLTALLAMRQAKAGFDAWRAGAHGGPQLAIIASAEAHYSVARTLRVMGLGDAGAIAAPVDAHHRLTADAVRRALDEAGDRRVIGVVCAAGSTATGSFDALDELADLCAERDLWLHVDAAHGGGLALSATHRDKLRGIGRADSVVWDAHKLLMMPALVTAVLFKRPGDAYAAFAQKASYLFEAGAPDDTWWDLGSRTLECTKRAMAVELWATLRAYGEGWFGAVVDRQIELAQALAARVRAAPDFELALPPECNIVCFRPRGAIAVRGEPAAGSPADGRGGVPAAGSPADGRGGVIDGGRGEPAAGSPAEGRGGVIDGGRGEPAAGRTAEGRGGPIDLRELRRTIIEDGRFYVVGTELAGCYWLRCTLMNPLTQLSDLDALLEHIRARCRA